MREKKFVRREIVVPENCPFCKGKTEPDYKDNEILKKYISDRGRLLGRSQTGLCAKHQRRLTVSIKQARHLGFLPFITRLG